MCALILIFYGVWWTAIQDKAQHVDFFVFFSFSSILILACVSLPALPFQSERKKGIVAVGTRRFIPLGVW